MPPESSDGPTPPRIGFIGLGDQGAPMARRVADAGLPLCVWARRADVAVAFAASAAIADTPAELAGASDIVGICVLADDDVLDVVLSAGGLMNGMAPGGVIAVHSTIHPRTLNRLADEGSPRGVAIVDAPVTGGAGKADVGELVVLAGGALEDVSRCRPMFDTYASAVVHLGGLGAGQTAKLVNNLAVTAHLSIATELFDFAQQMGVDRSAMASVLHGGSGGSAAADFLAASAFDLGDMWERSRRVLRKDLEIVLDLADASSAAVPHATVDAALCYLNARGDGLRRDRPERASVDDSQSDSNEMKGEIREDHRGP